MPVVPGFGTAILRRLSIHSLKLSIGAIRIRPFQRSTPRLLEKGGFHSLHVRWTAWRREQADPSAQATFDCTEVDFTLPVLQYLS